MKQDIRWEQRFSNYLKALEQLEKGIKENLNTTSEIIKEGIIQRFEFTHELAWKVLKDFLEYEGFQNITGSRSATREAFANGLIENGHEWMNMIESRNQTVHTYQSSILEVEYEKITKIYYPLFLTFAKSFKNRLN